MDPADVVRAWMDTFNARDWELDLALMSTDAETTIVAREETFTNAVDYQAGSRAFIEASPTSMSRLTT